MDTELKAFLEKMDQSGSPGLVLLGAAEAAEFPFELLEEKTSELPFVAGGREEEAVIRSKLPGATVVKRNDPACVDQLKIWTRGCGFSFVLVWDSDPAAVRMALGAAAVLGEIYLCFCPRGKVKADLHSTINYKSLIVKGGVRNEV